MTNDTVNRKAFKRGSHQRCSMKKGVRRNFTKFTGKHLCQILFFNKVAGLSPAILSKKRLWHRCFPVNFAKFLRASFFIEHLWWLLLVVLDNLLKLRNQVNVYFTLRKKCLFSELFWSALFPHFPAFGLNTERYGVSFLFNPNAGKCGKNVDQDNSEYGLFLRSVS